MSKKPISSQKKLIIAFVILFACLDLLWFFSQTSLSFLSFRSKLILNDLVTLRSFSSWLFLFLIVVSTTAFFLKKKSSP